MDERARALKALGLFDRISKLDRETMDSNLSAYTDHMADQGTEAMEREKAALFATKEGTLHIPARGGAAPVVQRPEDVWGLPHLWLCSRVRASRRAPTCAVLHRLQTERGGRGLGRLSVLLQQPSKGRSRTGPPTSPIASASPPRSPRVLPQNPDEYERSPRSRCSTSGLPGRFPGPLLPRFE